MCGRYSVTDPHLDKIAAARFGATLAFSHWQPRYNAAPTQALPVILNEDPRRVVLSEWGLVPHWAPQRRLINARSETIAQKFAVPFRDRRCLILADGFYEWKKLAGSKVPYRMTLADGGLFAFAGIWEEVRRPPAASANGEVETRFAIATTAPNALLGEIHDRMPVMLEQGAEDTWLLGDDDAARQLLAPYPPEAMRAYAVSPLVNSPRNDTARIVEPAGDPDA